MNDFLWYAFGLLVMPVGALWALYVVTRANARELERDRRLRSNHH